MTQLDFLNKEWELRNLTVKRYSERGKHRDLYEWEKAAMLTAQTELEIINSLIQQTNEQNTIVSIGEPRTNHHD
jgi:hypothetical protein